MSPLRRLEYLIVAAVIITAALTGLVVPLSSGGGLSWGGRATPIVVPPTPTASPTATRTATPTLPPLPPPTATPTATPAVTVAATSTFTITAEVTSAVAVTSTPTVTAALPVTPTVTATPAVEAAPTAAVTLTITATENVRVRQGPGMAYAILGTARGGDTFTVIGRNADSTWWQVCCLPGERSGWVFGGLVTLSGDPKAVPVVNVPPPPTATPVSSS